MTARACRCHLPRERVDIVRIAAWTSSGPFFGGRRRTGPIDSRRRKSLGKSSDVLGPQWSGLKNLEGFPSPRPSCNHLCCAPRYPYCMLDNDRPGVDDRGALRWHQEYFSLGETTRKLPSNSKKRSGRNADCLMAVKL